MFTKNFDFLKLDWDGCWTNVIKDVRKSLYLPRIFVKVAQFVSNFVGTSGKWAWAFDCVHEVAVEWIGYADRDIFYCAWILNCPHGANESGRIWWIPCIAPEFRSSFLSYDGVFTSSFVCVGWRNKSFSGVLDCFRLKRELIFYKYKLLSIKVEC